MKARRPGSLGAGGGGDAGRELSAAERGQSSRGSGDRAGHAGSRVAGGQTGGWTERRGLTFRVSATGHQGAVGALALRPVGAHLHLVVAVRVQVGELHRGHLAVEEVGFGLRVTLDPILHLLPGRGWSVGSSWQS